MELSSAQAWMRKIWSPRNPVTAAKPAAAGSYRALRLPARCCSLGTPNECGGRRSALVSAAGLLPLLASAWAPCPSCAVDAQAADWTYSGDTGPSQWGGLCHTGQQQSPIDIQLGTATGSQNDEEAQLQFKYSTCANVSVVQTGHGTLQVNVAPGSWCEQGGRRWQLLQWHFHTPSEHAFDGAHAAMETHLVHRDDNGELMVVGVLLRTGAEENPALRLALSHAPLAPGPAAAMALTKPVDVQRVLTASLGLQGEAAEGATYVQYAGSLTTPPCSEGVRWCVFQAPGPVTADQVSEFMATAGQARRVGNARPLAALNERALQVHAADINVAPGLIRAANADTACHLEAVPLPAVPKPAEPEVAKGAAPQPKDQSPDVAPSVDESQGAISMDRDSQSVTIKIAVKITSS